MVKGNHAGTTYLLNKYKSCKPITNVSDTHQYYLNGRHYAEEIDHHVYFKRYIICCDNRAIAATQ